MFVLLALAAPAQATHRGCGMLGLSLCPHTSTPPVPPPPPPDTAPEPAGNETAAVPTPPPGNKLAGFNSVLSERAALVSPATEFDLVKKAGANAHRIILHWLYAEPAPPVGGVHTWSQYYLGPVDVRYQAMRARGITPVIQLASAPPYAQPRNSLGWLVCPACTTWVEPAPEKFADWRAFVSMIATRYPDAAYEIWNEPNQRWAYKPAPNAARYKRVYTEAYLAIKAIDPAAIVVVGGIAGAGITDANQIKQSDFIRGLYGNGLKQHAPDFRLGLHVYPGGVALGQGSRFAAAWKEAMAATREWNDAGREIWVTETGITTTPQWMQGQNYETRGLVATPAQQGDITRRLYSRYMTMDSYGPADQRANVRAVIFHTLKENEFSSADSVEYGFGFLHHTPWVQPKPAFCWMVGAEPAGAPVRTYPGC